MSGNKITKHWTQQVGSNIQSVTLNWVCFLHISVRPEPALGIVSLNSSSKQAVRKIFMKPAHRIKHRRTIIKEMKLFHYDLVLLSVGQTGRDMCVLMFWEVKACSATGATGKTLLSSGFREEHAVGQNTVSAPRDMKLYLRQSWKKISISFSVVPYCSPTLGGWKVCCFLSQSADM